MTETETETETEERDRDSLEARSSATAEYVSAHVRAESGTQPGNQLGGDVKLDNEEGPLKLQQKDEDEEGNIMTEHSASGGLCPGPLL